MPGEGTGYVCRRGRVRARLPPSVFEKRAEEARPEAPSKAAEPDLGEPQVFQQKSLFVGVAQHISQGHALAWACRTLGFQTSELSLVNSHSVALVRLLVHLDISPISGRSAPTSQEPKRSDATRARPRRACTRHHRDVTRGTSTPGSGGRGGGGVLDTARLASRAMAVWIQSWNSRLSVLQFGKLLLVVEVP